MIGDLTILKQAELHGGNLNARDMKGRRPADIAEANRHTACENYLKSQALISKTQVNENISVDC